MTILWQRVLASSLAASIANCRATEVLSRLACFGAAAMTNLQLIS